MSSMPTPKRIEIEFRKLCNVQDICIVQYMYMQGTHAIAQLVFILALFVTRCCNLILIKEECLILNTTWTTCNECPPTALAQLAEVF